QEWKIEKVNDGVFNLTTNGKIAEWGAAETFVSFKISNLTAAAAKFYVGGSGDSLASNGDIYGINKDDATKKVKLAVRNESGNNWAKWSDTANAYVSDTELSAGATRLVNLGVPIGSTVAPGEYTVTVQLIAPSV
ncbi:hypothetical protein ACSN7O_004838, partial [Enterobacter chuandaensis]